MILCCLSISFSCCFPSIVATKTLASSKEWWPYFRLFDILDIILQQPLVICAVFCVGVDVGDGETGDSGIGLLLKNALALFGVALYDAGRVPREQNVVTDCHSLDSGLVCLEGPGLHADVARVVSLLNVPQFDHARGKAYRKFVFASHELYKTELWKDSRVEFDFLDRVFELDLNLLFRFF